jgi:broad specificity phosphatase PhoE
LPGPLAVEELREQRFGRWEGENWDEKLAGPEREIVQNLLKNFLDEAAPGGESFRQLAERVLRGWRKVEEKAEGPGPFVVTAHSGPVRVLLCHHRGLGLEKAFELRVPFGSVHEIPVTD